MKIMQFQVGMVYTNCYLVYDEQTMHGAVIDPGDSAPEILKKIEETGITLDYILLTHGHFDHILAVPQIREQTGAKLVIHKDDEWMLDPETMGMYRRMAKKFTKQVPDIRAAEGTTVQVGGITATYLHTPGHTPGSSCIQMENVLFTGDTLFRHECGRCDLEGGDFDTILKSLKRLSQVEGNLHVLPGHEATSTLDEERRGNPYIRQALQEA